MAGNKINFRIRVKASSLIEVVVAMVIILLVFAIAMGIYANILRLSLSLQKYRAQTTLNQVLKRLEKSPKVSEENFSRDGFNIKQDISRYQNHPELKEIHLTAVDENELKLAEIRKVVYESFPN